MIKLLTGEFSVWPYSQILSAAQKIQIWRLWPNLVTSQITWAKAVIIYCQLWGKFAINISTIAHAFASINTKYHALGLNNVSFPFTGRWLKTTSWQRHDLLHPQKNPEPGISWSVRERWNDGPVSIWTKPILDEEDVPCEERGQTWGILWIQDRTECFFSWGGAETSVRQSTRMI